MGKLWAVIKREYLERVRNKWFIFVTIFGPVFFAVIMVLPAYLSVRGIRDAKVGSGMRIVDASGVGLGGRVAARLATPALQGAPTPPAVPVDLVDPSSLAAAESVLVLDVMAEKLTGFLVLEPSTLETGRARYAGRNASSIGENEQVEGALRSALLGYKMETAGINEGLAQEITKLRARVATERITDKGRGGSGVASAIFGFVIAFLLYMTIILYGQAILRGVLEEKTTRVAEVIVSSVKPDTLLAGKVIGVGAVGLTQYAVWILSGYLLYGQRAKLLGAMGVDNVPATLAFPSIEPLMLIALILFFLLGYTFYASLFAAVGAMVGSQEEANQAAQPVMMLLVLSIIFVQPVMLNPTGQLAKIMSWMPFSAPIIMPLRMTATPVSPVEIGAVLLGLLVACVGVIWVSARIYRVGMLMYGKRPSLRELARWVRQS
jgi:ABC-2 type transport system permease protein